MRNALTKASKSLHGLRWFEVTNVRGDIANRVISHYPVTLKVGFTLDE